MATYQDFRDRSQKNPNRSPLEDLKEQLKIVTIDLNCAILYPNSFSEEKVNDLKNQKKYLLTKIQKIEWAGVYNKH
jgi:hypothetical protein